MREIRPRPDLNAKVTLPGSKSYTQRALIIAALAEGNSLLTGALLSEDTEVMMDALRLLGVKITTASSGIAIEGTGGAFSSPSEDIYLGNNGTALRFLTTLSCLAPGVVNLTGMARLQERPVGPLISALRTLGANIHCPVREGFPPLQVQAGPLRGGRVRFADLESSQYISSLLLSAPYAREDVELELTGHTVSRPYLDLTLAAMKDFGVDVEKSARGYRVAAGQRYRGRTYRVEGDASSASYFFLAAALTNGRMEVANLSPDSLQGDVKFLDILRDMGCLVERQNEGVIVRGRKLAGGDCLIDMGDIPDLVPTMAVLAAFREGKTAISNCAHLKHKESDRLAVLVEELGKMGISAQETNGGLEIIGGSPRAALVNAHEDHRIAMAFAIAGLALPGMKIEGDHWVNKSFPAFWEELERL